MDSGEGMTFFLVFFYPFRISLLLLQHLQRFPDKCGDVVRLTARDEIPVDDNFGVHVLGPSVFDILHNGFPSRHAPALQHLGGDEELGSVADGKDRFFILEELPGEPQRVLVDPEPVGRVSAGDEQGVEILCRDISCRPADLRDGPVLAFYLDAGPEADEGELMAGFPEGLGRAFVFHVLEHVRDDDCYSGHGGILSAGVD